MPKIDARLKNNADGTLGDITRITFFISALFVATCFVLIALFFAFHGFTILFVGQSQARPAETPILVAAFDMQEGERIQTVHLRTVQIARRLGQRPFFLSGEEHLLLGREVAVDFSAGTPLMEAALKPLLPGNASP